MHDKKLRVIQIGCGPIGCQLVEMLSARKNIEIVGALDIDPAKVGRALSEVALLDMDLGLTVVDDVESVLADNPVDVAFHTTTSCFRSACEQIEPLINAGLQVVSTCEEMVFPYRTHPNSASRLDQNAQAQGVSVLATGINPGFLMDTWPLAMTAVCQQVRHVRALRIQDAATRRLPFQQKIGVGLTPQLFTDRVNKKEIRHVGLPESVAMIASGLGWVPDDIQEDIEPIVAHEEVVTQTTRLSVGQVAGIRQVCRGHRAGQELILLEFQAYLGAERPQDSVAITGTPSFEAVIDGGIHGDIATAAVAVNAAERIIDAKPGLITMQDLPIVVSHGV